MPAGAASAARRTCIANGQRMTTLAARRTDHLFALPPGLLPGLTLVVAMAIAASLLAMLWPALGAPIIGLCLALVWANLRPLPAVFAPGLRFAGGPVLRLAIVLLGTQISVAQIAGIGWETGLVVVAAVATAIGGTFALGTLFGLPRRLTLLTGFGVGICGCTAVATLSPLIRASERETAYAMGTISACNLIALLLYPALARQIGLDDLGFGTWAATAIHDTSSVVAAGYLFSDAAGAQSVVVKLARTLFLVPVVALVAIIGARGATRDSVDGRSIGWRSVVPGFIVVFLAAVVANSAGLVPAAIGPLLGDLAKFLIVMALVAVGFSVRLADLRQVGLAPLAVGLGASAAVGAVTLLLIRHLT